MIFLMSHQLKFFQIIDLYLLIYNNEYLWHALQWAKADCFDFAIVLVSLLIVVGYDAYVVVGYAPRATTSNDQVEFLKILVHLFLTIIMTPNIFYHNGLLV
jgi:transglutaminase-like putative cysteine protease